MNLKNKLLKNTTLKYTSILTESEIYNKKDEIKTDVPGINIALSGNPYRDSGNCTGCDLSAWRPGYLGHLQSDVFYTGCSFRY